VASVLFQVPNQRLYFHDDWWYSGGVPYGRKEDQLCSYTWRLFLNDLVQGLLKLRFEDYGFFRILDPNFDQISPID